MKALQDLGSLTLLSVRVVRQLPKLYGREFWRGMLHFGVESLPLTFMVALVSGAAVVLQTSLYVQRFGARTQLGWAAGFAVVWEFGPLFLGLVMAARVGARNAAELATMKVTGQLEGLQGISLNPIALLVAPRVLAAALSVICLSAFTFLVAVTSEALAALLTLGIPVRVFLGNFASALGPGDLLGGVLKCAAYGVAIALVSTHSGMNARGGSTGVGIAAAKAVVYSCASIFTLDFLLTPVLSRWLA